MAVSSAPYMSEPTTSAMTAAERQRVCRARKRERGQPSVPAFDSALREHVFALYQAGELQIDIPDLVRIVTERLAAAGAASERGCRDTVRSLLSKAGGDHAAAV
jgi:hypothetical protein